MGRARIPPSAPARTFALAGEEPRELTGDEALSALPGSRAISRIVTI